MSNFIKNRKDFIDKRASEKNVLITVEATTRLINWNLISGGIYKRSVDQYSVDLHDCIDRITQVDEETSVVPGTWYFNPKTNEITLNLIGDSDPNEKEMVVTYRFFYSDTTMTASHDLTDNGYHVLYDGRVSSSPGYNHKIGYEQNLTSVVGQGTLKLYNQDGALDDIFDRYFFENQEVKVYSWNRNLCFSEAQIMYRGKVTNKTFDSKQITFTVKDPLFDLEQPVPTGIYTEDDNVDDSLLGKSKRWVYGRVDGIRSQSLDKIGDGFVISGTVVGQQDSKLLTGTGTLFLTETTPGDKMIISDQSFTIDRVINDTTIFLTSIIKNGFNDSQIILNPDKGTTIKNRRFQITSHACSESAATVVDAFQLNRILVDTTEGFFSGDTLQVGSSGERIEIKNVAPGNIIVLTQAITNKPLIGDTLTRLAIQDVFHNGEELIDEDYTIDNTTNGCFIDLSGEAEINIADTFTSDIQLQFINGSRNVIVLGDFDTLKSTIKVNDLIRSTELTSTTFRSVIDINEIESTNIDYVDYLNANFPILDFNGINNFPTTGQVGRVYREFFSKQLYSWDGAQYVLIDDIYEAPATNYHTASRLYIKDEDKFKYNTGMEITIETNSVQHTSEISFVSTVDGDSYIDLVTPYSQSFVNGDSINSINAISLRTPVSEPTSIKNFDYKSPNFIQDNSVVSVDILGKTKDGTPSGDWIKTGPEAVLDIIQEVGITDIDFDRFEEARLDAKQLLSLTIPQSNNSKQQDARAAINLINKTIIGSLNMNNDLQLQYRIIQPNIDEENIPQINDYDLINWTIKTVNGRTIQSVGVDYRHMDYDNATEEAGSLNAEYSYDFVDKYIGTTARDDLDIYLYEEFDAKIRGHREAYYRSLSRADITLESDLRLENYSIGDSIVLNLDRLYRRLGDNYKKKVVMVVGKRVTGKRITLMCTDFGNIYNRSNIITRNDAPCYEDATEEDKLKLGFITDNRGIIDENEDTHNSHLIS